MKFSMSALLGVAGAVLVASSLAFTPPVTNNCHMQFLVIDGASRWGCVGDCANPQCKQKSVGGGKYDCACDDGAGPVPYCCHTGVQTGIPTVPVGLGHCGDGCPEGSCDPVWHPQGTEGDGEWIAECQ